LHQLRCLALHPADDLEREGYGAYGKLFENTDDTGSARR
jgi:hypothetical protein